MIMPNLFVIGAQKSATTSLCALLSEHPEVFFTQPKEPMVFALPNFDPADFQKYLTGYQGEKIVGDGSTNNSVFSFAPHAAGQIHENSPDAKIIYIVRDPMARTYSAWWHYLARNEKQMPRDFSHAVRTREILIEPSLYMRQLNVYLKYFSASNIKVFFVEDFRARPNQVLEECCRFLGVDHKHKFSKPKRRQNVAVKNGLSSLYTPKQIPQPAVEFLQNKLATDTREFLQFCGKPLDFWGDWPTEKGEASTPKLSMVATYPSNLPLNELTASWKELASIPHTELLVMDATANMEADSLVADIQRSFKNVRIVSASDDKNKWFKVREASRFAYADYILFPYGDLSISRREAERALEVLESSARSAFVPFEVSDEASRISNVVFQTEHVLGQVPHGSQWNTIVDNLIGSGICEPDSHGNANQISKPIQGAIPQKRAGFNREDMGPSDLDRIMIIGAMKAGTTSLFELLAQHKQIAPAVVKEPEYFSRHQGHRLEIENYDDLFEIDKGIHTHTLEASTGYTKFPDEVDVPRRISEYGLQPYFIYVVRDPIRRIESELNFTKQNKMPWADTIGGLTDSRLFNRSMYFMQMREYLKVFPDMSRYHIVDFDRLISDPLQVCDEICRWLGLRSQQFQPVEAQNQTVKLSRFEQFIDSQPSGLNRSNKLVRSVSRLTGSAEKRFKGDQIVDVRNYLELDIQRFGQLFEFDVSKWGFDTADLFEKKSLLRRGQFSQASSKLISFVIITHNRQSMLDDCLQALLPQVEDAADIEVIVVDNASVDRTKEVVAAYQKSLSNLRYVYEPELGICAARNRGLLEARGKYLSQLDDDTLPLPQYVVNLKALLRTDDGVGCVAGPTEYTSDAHPPRWMTQPLWHYLSVYSWGEDTFEVDSHKLMVGANMTFLRDALTAVGGYDERYSRRGGSLESGEETDVRQKLDRRGLRQVYSGKLAVKHQIPAERWAFTWFARRAIGQGKSEARSYIANDGWFSLRQACRLFRDHALYVGRRTVEYRSLRLLALDVIRVTCFATELTKIEGPKFFKALGCRFLRIETRDV